MSESHMPIANVNGINLSYKIAGQGEPLFLIMGLDADQSGWSSEVSFFKKHYQVVTFDNRGSASPTGRLVRKQPGLMADDTVRRYF
jgi:pimeloyl-ACP methyl ester carboxylesterase